jgi:hypothetical protein
VSDSEEAAFAKWAAEELESHWKIDAVSVRESARQAQAADAGKVRRDRKDVSQIHLEGVIGLLPKTEGGLR